MNVQKSYHLRSYNGPGAIPDRVHLVADNAPRPTRHGHLVTALCGTRVLVPPRDAQGFSVSCAKCHEEYRRQVAAEAARHARAAGELTRERLESGELEDHRRTPEGLALGADAMVADLRDAAPRLDGCTCEPVRGSHRPGCQWAARR